ncbi:MAG: PD-(D/E)XK nuclease family protein [Candidatus Omnitrophica bacterium]|nr:PD-(D/E)XK nuclease family protein [Candidatus Omnitrophota bacterium]MDD5081544.1 PD-(D/E)XK nuclease family protein [Candidatus Omnitrophota bacterium]MDD5440953.1 PD-(D/E)XK nuclease family protein [Candidatus Omnitrophota bacterium]
MGKLKNKFSWSFSRSQLFNGCKRAYFYNYYASWGGWEKAADEQTRKIYILKNVRNIDAWVGDIIHQVIKWVIECSFITLPWKTEQGITYEEALNKAKQMLIKTWEQSRSCGWKDNVKQNLNLFEHYYNVPLEQDVLKQKLQKVTKSLTNFYKLGIPDKLRSINKDNILSVDSLDSFIFKDIEVYSVPDFALKDGDDYVLYDWKTGKRSDKDALQLSLYILYASGKWKLKPENIKIVPVYLNEDAPQIEFINNVPLVEVQEYMLKSISDMKEVLSDPANNIIDIKLCPVTQETWRCKNCKFKEVCPKN